MKKNESFQQILMSKEDIQEFVKNIFSEAGKYKLNFENSLKYLSADKEDRKDFKKAFQKDREKNHKLLQTLSHIVLNENIKLQAVKVVTKELNEEGEKVRTVRGYEVMIGEEVVWVQYGEELNAVDEVIYRTFVNSLETEDAMAFQRFIPEADLLKTKINSLDKAGMDENVPVTGGDETYFQELRRYSNFLKEFVKGENKKELNAYFEKFMREVAKNNEEYDYQDLFGNSDDLDVSDRDSLEGIATIFETAQHTTVFPLEDANLPKKDTDIYKRVSDYMRSPENRWLNLAEDDLTVSEGEIEVDGEIITAKRKSLELLLFAMQELNKLDLPIKERSIDLRLRLLGKHESKYRIVDGFSKVGGEDGFNQLVVSVVGNGHAAIMAVTGQLIYDLIFRGTRMADEILKHFRRKVVTKGMSRGVSAHYLEGTRIMGRLIDLVHTKRHGNQASNPTSLSHTEAYFKENQNIYFGSENWSQEEWELAEKVYDTFLKGEYDLEIEADLLEKIRSVKEQEIFVSRREELGKVKGSRSEASKIISSLTENFRSGPEGFLEDLFADLMEEYRTGEYSEFGLKYHVSAMTSFFKEGYLLKDNSSANRKSLSGGLYLEDNHFRYLNLVQESFKMLSPADKLDILGDSSFMYNYAYIVNQTVNRGSLANGMNSIISEETRKNLKDSFESARLDTSAKSRFVSNSFLANLTGEDLVELMDTDPVATFQVIVNYIQTKPYSTQKDKNIENLFRVAVDAGSGISIDGMDKEKVEGLIEDIRGWLSELNTGPAGKMRALKKRKSDMYEEYLERYLEKIQTQGEKIGVDTIVNAFDIELLKMFEDKAFIEKLVSLSKDEKILEDAKKMGLEENPAEAFLKTVKNGVEPSKVIELLKGHLSDSEVAELKVKSKYLIQTSKLRLNEAMRSVDTKYFLADLGIDEKTPETDNKKVNYALEVVRRFDIMKDKVRHLGRFRDAVKEDVKERSAKMWEEDYKAKSKKITTAVKGRIETEVEAELRRLGDAFVVVSGEDDTVVYANESSEALNEVKGEFYSIMDVIDDVEMLMIDNGDEVIFEEFKEELLENMTFVVHDVEKKRDKVLTGEDSLFFVEKRVDNLIKTGDVDGIIAYYDTMLAKVLEGVKKMKEKKLETKKTKKQPAQQGKPVQTKMDFK